MNYHTGLSFPFDRHTWTPMAVHQPTCKYPLQFLCDFANAVLDDKTGNLLEYRHLLKHPKYKRKFVASCLAKKFGT